MQLARPAIALFAAASLISGCAPLFIVGAAETGRIVAQERPIGTAINDISAQADIESRLASNSFKLFQHVAVRVIQGRVLLAGHVKDEEIRAQAGQLAGGVDNVREVNNEITVGGGSIGSNLNDFRISSQMRTKLMADYKISSVNYHVQTVDGTVFLLGVARDEAELDRVALHARTIAGVKKVVSYVQLKDDAGRREM